MNAKWKLPEISYYFWSYYHFNASDLFAGTGTGVVFPELSPFLREADDTRMWLDFSFYIFRSIINNKSQKKCKFLF